MPKQTIDMIPQNLSVGERGQRPIPAAYKGLARQQRRRLQIVDEDIQRALNTVAALEEKKARIMKELKLTKG